VPTPPTARTALDALTGDPVRLLITGGIGTGKSTVLEAVRRSLRESGRTVVSRIPDRGDADSAVLIDDAHLLDDASLQVLADLTDDPNRSIVVAAETRDHDPALRTLATALERDRSRIALGPLNSGEIAHAVADPSGHPPSPEVLSGVMAASAGIPCLVGAIASAPRPLSAASVTYAAEMALIERLRRLDQAELEALVIASLSTDLGATDLAAALGVESQRGLELIDRARGTGLIQPSYQMEFLRSVHRAAAHLVGAARHHELEKALLRTQLDSSTLSSHLALELAEHGFRDDSLARWLRERTADGLQDLNACVRMHRAAVAAGARDMRAALADALAVSGDTPAAAALADELLGSTDADERAVGVRIAASVAASNGNCAHAAELFNWLGPYSDAAVGSAAVLVYIATGDLPAGRAALQSTRAGPPTGAARVARSLAEGILLTIDGPYPAAASRLGLALAGEHTVASAMPDSASALVTLAALNSGDSVRARSVIDRAVREYPDGRAEPLFTKRHRLLRGWLRMQDGQLSAASADADTVGASRGRDGLWVAALRTAIARRGGDIGALYTHWSAGMEALAESSIDLFSLLPLGELWVAGARLRQSERLTPALEQGFGVLAALGEPTAWAPMLHWSGVHAGILAGDPLAVAPHGQALTAMAERSGFAAALAAAGRTWLKVLANQVNADEVIAAARGLAQFGLTSDATRLAAQAALQAQDTKTSALMLQAARDLKLSAGSDSDPAPEGGEPERRPRPASTTLSDREREVAELLLLGMPYRDIGTQLFISAKTVEHHVARIRRRLGAESRSEMLSMLRALVAPEA
jgi:DNA-binding NarL/FixJ family response regulator